MPLTNDDKQSLIEMANKARVHAYAPYSHYAVGAALRTKSGRVYTGVNIENAAYPTGICAERVALFKAVSEGEREFEALALVTDNGGTPCGSCRQVIAEFGLDTVVLIANAHEELLSQISTRELLPGAFLPNQLGI